MSYEKELNIIVTEIKKAYSTLSKQSFDISQKTKHDLVTDLDKNIEMQLSKVILDAFGGDKILGEEMSSNTVIDGRTWTIDPIDGTCNMASGIGLFGIQCSLFEGDQIVLAVAYIPTFDYLITAVKGEGCYLNGKRVVAKSDIDINNAIISFGDYPHKNSDRPSIRSA